MALRAIAVGGGLLALAAIIFGSNGMHLGDVSQGMQGHWGIRAGLWGGWVALGTPVAAGALEAPGTQMLRSLVPRRTLVVYVTLLLVLAQLPWSVLLARQPGILGAATAALLAVALETSLIATVRNPAHILLTAPAIALVFLDLPAVAAVAPAALLAYRCTHVAWTTPQVPRAPLLALTRPTHPVLALAMAELLALVRTARARLASATLIASLGGAALFCSWRNDPPLRPIARALLCFTLPLSIVASVLVAPLLTTERRLGPLLRSTLTPARVLLFALALAIGAPSSALAGTSSAVAVSLAGGPTWTVTGAVIAWTLALALAIAAWARRHDQTQARSPAIFMAGVLVLDALFMGAASW